MQVLLYLLLHSYWKLYHKNELHSHLLYSTLTFHLVRDLPWYRSTVGVAMSYLHNYWICSLLCVEFRLFLCFLIQRCSFGWETIYYYILYALSIQYDIQHFKSLVQDAIQWCIYLFTSLLTKKNRKIKHEMQQVAECYRRETTTKHCLYQIFPEFWFPSHVLTFAVSFLNPSEIIY